MCEAGRAGRAPSLAARAASVGSGAPTLLPPLPCSLPAAPLQVRSGLGSLPPDFDAVVRRAAGRLSGSGTASNLALWEAYAAAHMLDPTTAKL